MNITYENNQTALTWKYAVVAHTHSTKKIGGDEGISTTQFFIPLNNKLIDMADIRQVIFLYQYGDDKKTCLTTHEPPRDVDYKLIRVYSNKNRKTIQLPPNKLPLDKNKTQTVTINYYPQTHDYYSENHPLITIDIEDVPKEQIPSTAKVVKEDGKVYLQWLIKPNAELPDDLLQFLSENQKEAFQEIEEETIICVDTKTQTVHVKTCQSENK